MIFISIFNTHLLLLRPVFGREEDWRNFLLTLLVGRSLLGRLRLPRDAIGGGQGKQRGGQEEESGPAGSKRSSGRLAEWDFESSHARAQVDAYEHTYRQNACVCIIHAYVNICFVVSVVIVPSIPYLNKFRIL